MKQPRSYKDWVAAMLTLGVPGAEEWARQAVEASGVTAGKLARMNAAYTSLVEADYDPFTATADDQVRAAFSGAFDGVVVEGPEPDPIPFGEEARDGD